MATICPTVTAETPQEYAANLAEVAAFAARIHIDVADSAFTPRQLIMPAQVYLPQDVMSDIHVMLEEPAKELMTLISLRPHLVIFHAESKGDLAGCLGALQKAGIAAGIALLPDTQVADAAPLITLADHVLIFAGHLGFQGGTADMNQVQKIAQIKALNAKAEIAWDGGINDHNAAELAAAGVDVLNVGGFIHDAADPTAAYQRLSAAVERPRVQSAN
ncbi:MAG TPA: hypothetical protein VLF60_04240 [Candidatus Saccharimonadales bacterium]|nr:hypothetical protein [Candidatus Saccharimonadales bacterium]